jgi:hypothetical protein
VIAGGDDGDAGAQQINRDFRRNATASRGVFAVHDDEIQGMLPLQFWQRAITALRPDSPTTSPRKRIVSIRRSSY